MKYIVYIQKEPPCVKCKEIIYNIISQGHEAEVLTDESLAAIEPDRRSSIMAEIQMTGSDKLPIVIKGLDII